jgi:hypothetical protein
MVTNFPRKKMHQLFNTQFLSPNASYKVIKILKQQGTWLALCCRSFCFHTAYVEVKIVLHWRILSLGDNFFLYYGFFLEFYT